MDGFENSAWILWLALALVFAGIEAATVDFVFLMVAGGAVAGAVAAAAGLGLPAQIAVAVIVATALLGVVRPGVKKRLLKGPDPVLGASAHLGAIAPVLETVTVNDGRIKLGGETWSARVRPGSAPLLAGQSVQVVAIDGATAIVEPAPGARDQIRQGE